MSRSRGGGLWWLGARGVSPWHMSMYGGWGRGSGLVGWWPVVASAHEFVNVGWSHRRKEREEGKIEGRRNAVPFTTLSR